MMEGLDEVEDQCLLLENVCCWKTGIGIPNKDGYNARETLISVDRPILDNQQPEWHIPSRFSLRRNYTKMGKWFPIKTIQRLNVGQSIFSQSRHR